MSHRFRRAFRVWAPALAIALFFVAAPVAFGAPANPAGVTAQSCSFGSAWTDGLSRWIFGVSIVLMALAALAGGIAMRSGGGGEAVGGAIGGVAGIGIVLGLLGAAGLLSQIAISAAGGAACP